MLANTPQKQMEIALNKVNRSARRFSNRSMVTGSNALILERRFSEMRNSPSGSYLVHPNSRIPDGHPTDLLDLKRVLEDSRMTSATMRRKNSLSALL